MGHESKVYKTYEAKLINIWFQNGGGRTMRSWVQPRHSTVASSELRDMYEVRERERERERESSGTSDKIGTIQGLKHASGNN